MTNCHGMGRHWFTFYRQPGLRSPLCVRCGDPNPRPLTDDEWAALAYYRKVRGYPLRDDLEAALTAHATQETGNGSRHDPDQPGRG